MDVCIIDRPNTVIICYNSATFTIKGPRRFDFGNSENGKAVILYVCFSGKEDTAVLKNNHTTPFLSMLVQ